MIQSKVDKEDNIVEKEMVIIMRKKKMVVITKIMKMTIMIKKEVKTRARRGKTGDMDKKTSTRGENRGA